MRKLFIFTILILAACGNSADVPQSASDSTALTLCSSLPENNSNK